MGLINFLKFCLTAAVCACLAACGLGSTESPPSDVAEPAWELPDAARTKDTIKVGSLNMYVGFNVPQLLIADLSNEDVVYEKSTELLADFLRSRPQERLAKMAEVLLDLNLDIVGMQEVTDLYHRDSLLVNYPEFLVDTLNSLAGEPRYAYYRQKLNDISFEATHSVSGDNIDLRFIEGNAILYKTTFTVVDSQNIKFITGLPDQNLMGDPVNIERGFQLLILNAAKSSESRTLQVFNTHLEVIRSYSKTQADELLTFANDMDSENTLQILVGDMNETTGVGADTIFTAGGFIDTYKTFVPTGDGFTCCMGGESFILPADAALPSSRIDYIYARKITKVIGSQVYLNENFAFAADTVFHPSDHSMPVSSLEFQY